MTEQIVWRTEQIRLGDLVNWEKNPVTLSKHDYDQIKISIEKFGMVLPLVANQPTSSGKARLIDGHQRKTILTYSQMADDDTLLDVRVPSRKLTERECDELSIRLRRNTGDFDFDILANEFDVADLIDWGFEEYELGITGEIDLDYEPEDSENKGFVTMSFFLLDYQRDEITEALNKVEFDVPGNPHENSNALYYLLCKR